MKDEKCPKCGSSLNEPTSTASGKRMQKCSKGIWNPETKKNDGCDYVLWLEVPPETLSEKCPKCGNPLILQTTRFGKKMKKCSTNKWDPDTKKSSGCDFVEWINGTTEELDEVCPDCGNKLVLFTTNAGKRMKKCSTSGWDSKAKKATGCKYVEWLKPEYKKQEEDSGGEEFLPPEPEGDEKNKDIEI